MCTFRLCHIDHRTLEAQGIERAPTTHLGPSVAAMERKGISTLRGSRNRRREDAALQSAVKPVSAPTLAPTLEECQAVLLALAKQELYKTDAHYLAQIKPYMEYFTKAGDKVEAFAFCRERMQADSPVKIHSGFIPLRRSNLTSHSAGMAFLFLASDMDDWRISKSSANCICVRQPVTA